MKTRFDLTVIGAGPAGAHAAMAAGVDCVVIDEAEAVGVPKESSREAP